MVAGDIRLFSGSSHPSLAAEIAKKLGVPLGKLETKHFPCGEYYVRYGESVRGQEIFLLQTFRTNRVHDDLMELLLMIDTAPKPTHLSTPRQGALGVAFEHAEEVAGVVGVGDQVELFGEVAIADAVAQPTQR